MLIEADKATIVSNITGGDTTEMKISAEGMAHIMNTLTNLYKDPEQAVIREYFCNALDSHTMSGQTLPVDVYLPTRDNLMFVVQDYGLGMSVDDIKNVYSQYGASTKRDSNKPVGAYGVGAKSALAIAHQFTLTSVKDGKKATVLIQKSADGISPNTVTIISVIDTEEGNGVKVSVPVDRNSMWNFRSTAQQYFRFVDPSTVLVDGVTPTNILTDKTLLKDENDPEFVGYADLTHNASGLSYVIMGPVPYVLTDSEMRESLARLKIEATDKLIRIPKFFPVEIGDVHLTAQREGLRFTPETKARVDKLVKSFVNSISKGAQTEIDNITERAKVLEVVKRWESTLGLTFQWNGEDVPRTIKLDGPVSTIRRKPGGDSSHGVEYAIDPFQVDQIIVTGQPYDKYKRISGYITDYMSLHDLKRVRFIFTEELGTLDTKWVMDNGNFSFEVFEDMINEVKSYRKEVRAAQRAGLPPKERKALSNISYPVLNVESEEIEDMPYKDIPADSRYLSEKNLYDGLGRLFDGSPAVTEIVAQKLGAATEAKYVVLVNKRRSLETLVKRVKGLHSLREDILKVSQKITDLATDEVKRYRGLKDSYYTPMLFNLSNLDEVLDTDVRKQFIFPEEVKAASVLIDDLLKVVDMFNFIDSSGRVDRYSLSADDDDTKGLDYSQRYPLLRSLMSAAKVTHLEQHIVLYMNAVYSTLVNPEEV